MKKILFLSSIVILSSPILAVVSCNNKSNNNSSESTTQESKIEVTKTISYDGIINQIQLSDQTYLQNANFVYKPQLEFMNDPKIKEFVDKNKNKTIEINIKWTCKSGSFDELTELTNKIVFGSPSTNSIKSNDTQEFKTTYDKILNDENLKKYSKYFASSEKASIEFNFILIAK